jgi:uncharacterized membrane protein
MSRYAATGLATLLIILVMDALWISQVALPQYRATLGELLEFRAVPAVAFYLVYVAGLCVFVLSPAMAAESWKVAAVNGALFGLFAYATFTLTNYAILRPWTLGLTLADIGWGAVMTGAASALGLLAGDAVLRMLRG